MVVCVLGAPAFGRVTISEVHYHPPEPDGKLLEFVELQNDGDAPVSIEGWRFSEGVEFRFPAGAFIPAGGHVVVARNADALVEAFGIAGAGVFGDFEGSLDNRGERLTLVDARSAWVDGVYWDDRAPWPEEADGEGSSLQRLCTADPAHARNWSGGFAEFPTPLEPNPSAACPAPDPRPTGVVINEIHFHPPGVDGPELAEFVELLNPTAEAVDLSGWRVEGIDFEFPAAVTLAPGELLVVCKDETTVRTLFGIANTIGNFAGDLSNGSERLALVTAEGTVVDSVRYGDDDEWPIAADGQGRSLERISATAESDDPANWAASRLLPGEFQTTVLEGSLTSLSRQRVLFGINGPGEFIVDDLSLVAVDEPEIELIPNGDFEEGLGEWLPRRNAELSVVEAGIGVGGSTGMRVITTGTCGATCDGCPSSQSVSLTLGALDEERTYRFSISWRYVSGAPDFYAGMLRGMTLCLSDALTSAGEPNAAASAVLPPHVSDRGRFPLQPTSADSVWISARVRSPSGDPIESVDLEYTVGEASASAPLLDDGLSGDGDALDGVWGGQLPPQPHGTAVLYRFIARTASGRSTVYPLSLDPETSPLDERWGYYVDDEQPQSPLPVYHLLIADVDPEDPEDINSVLNCNILEPSHFVYEGEVYPNVGVRFRGNTACVLKKRNFKLRFNRGREFRGLRKMNLQGIWTDKALVREHLAWDFIRQVGVPYCETEYVRVHLNGGYHGLFLYLEHPDEVFLQRNGLESTDCLYKARQPSGVNGTPIGVSVQPTPGSYASFWEQETCEDGDFTPIAEFIGALHADGNSAGGPTAEFFLDRSKPRELIAYQIFQSGLNNIDSFAKNHFLYWDRTADRWSLLTWDMDLTFGKNFDGRLNRPNPPRVGTINDCMLSPGDDLNPWFTTTVLGNFRLHWFMDFFFRAGGGYFQRAYLIRLWDILEEKLRNEVYDPILDDLVLFLEAEQAEDFDRWSRTEVTCILPCNCARSLDMAGSVETVKQQIGLHRDFLRRYIERWHPEIPLHDRMKITELHYNPTGRSEDLEFIEILNTTGRQIDISGWALTDGVEFRFPPASLVPADGIVIVAANRDALINAYPGVETRALIFGNYAGELGNDGGRIRLVDGDFDDYPATIDLVEYLDVGPWPEARDGFSIELTEVSPIRDNDFGANWVESSAEGGTPGTLFAASPEFLRADVDEDGEVQISDAIRVLNWLFSGGDEPPCQDAADVDDDGAAVLSDAVLILLYLFQGGQPPEPPFPEPGVDPTPDELGCLRA